MPGVTIRRATPEDARVIAEIHVASWQHAYRGIMPDAALDAMTPDDRLPMWQYILTLPDAPTHVGVAEVMGEVVGFFSIGRSDEGDPADVQMLYTLYMQPDFTGQGVGRLLMHDAERRMQERGATLCILRVITANKRTLAFYERCGWTPEPASIRNEAAWGQEVETIRYRKRLG